MANARVKSIEGLRALAIASVVAYHLEVNWLPSGHMGVVMFLVLTGYLVTNSILREFDRTGDVNLPSFWGRRLKRLWPPMAAMILIVCVACIALNHVALTKMRPDILPSLLFFDNWNYIVNGLSYFDKIGGVSPLTHLWYLGVDVQLCILWPLLLTVGLKLSHNNKGAMAIVAGVFTLVSAVLMAALYVPGTDPSRVYYGCDTRAFAVLAGALLAFMWPLGYMPVVGRNLLVEQVGVRRFADPASPRGFVDRPVFAPSTAVEVFGWVGLVGLVVIMVVVPPTSQFFYYGGMLLATILTCMLMMSLLSPGTLLNRAFSCAPLQWLGSRSFSLYLWHYPVIVLMGASGGAAWWLKLLAAAVSLGVAELAWRFIEQPLGNKELMARILRAYATGCWHERMRIAAGSCHRWLHRSTRSHPRAKGCHLLHRRGRRQGARPHGRPHERPRHHGPGGRRRCCPDRHGDSAQRHARCARSSADRRRQCRRHRDASRPDTGACFPA